VQAVATAVRKGTRLRSRDDATRRRRHSTTAPSRSFHHWTSIRCLAGEPPGALSVPGLISKGRDAGTLNPPETGRWDVQPAGGGTLGHLSGRRPGRWDAHHGRWRPGVRDAGTLGPPSDCATSHKINALLWPMMGRLSDQQCSKDNFTVRGHGEQLKS
jgi:hypothetical protein